MVLAHRVKESNFDDLLLEPSYKGAVGLATGKRLTTESDNAARGPIEIPDKIFVRNRRSSDLIDS